MAVAAWSAQHAEQVAVLANQSGPEEDRQDAQEQPAIKQRLPGKALDPFPSGPFGVFQPDLIPLEVGDLDRFGAGGDHADLLDVDRKPTEPSLHAGPILLSLKRPAGTGDEVQAGSVVGTDGEHRTHGADVAGPLEPDPGQGDIGEHGQAVDDQPEQHLHRMLLGHVQQELAVRSGGGA